MQIRVRNKTMTNEDGQPKIVAEVIIEMSPADVKDTGGGGAGAFYRALGEDIIAAIQNYKPYKKV